MQQPLTIEGIFVFDEGLLALGVGGLIGLCQSAPSSLCHVRLVKGFGKAHHCHVLPLCLAFVVLLQMDTYTVAQYA